MIAMENKPEVKKSYSFKGILTTTVIFLILFSMIRSCFSSDSKKDEKHKTLYRFGLENGKNINNQYIIKLNLLDINENIILPKEKNLYSGYTAKIQLFENDDWYSFKYDFKQIGEEGLDNCIIDTSIQLKQQSFTGNSIKLILNKNGINTADNVFLAFKILDPKGNVIGEGKEDYNDFSFEIDQIKASDYDITLNGNALVVSDAELSRSFTENEISADEMYKGKLVEVSGRIDDFGKSSYGDIQYILHGSSFGGGIQCVLDFTNDKKHKEKYLKLKKGQTVTIRGYVQGLIGGVSDLEKALGKTKGDNVFLEKCIVK